MLEKPAGPNVRRMKITAIIPWLVKAESSCWGGYLFGEAGTDAGVSDWGEITSTTKPTNRAVAGILRQLTTSLSAMIRAIDGFDDGDVRA
jgi:hypothetical protein